MKDKRTNRWLSRIEEEAVGKFTPEQATSCTEPGGEENRGAQRPASRWVQQTEAATGTAAGEAGRGRQPAEPQDVACFPALSEKPLEGVCAGRLGMVTTPPGRTRPLTTLFPAVSEVSAAQVISYLAQNS